MQPSLRRMRARRADDDRGFTLIELLVVVVIIGVLVAIAIPMYLNYRKGAENKSAESDVRGAISAVEQFYTENANQYPDPKDNAGAPGTPVILKIGAGTATQTITTSSGNTLSYVRNGLVAVATTYWVCGFNADGATVYVYNSATGGSVGKSTSTTFALCVTSGL